MFVLEESHQNVRACQKRISRGNRFGFYQLPLDTVEQRTEKQRQRVPSRIEQKQVVLLLLLTFLCVINIQATVVTV